MSARSIYIPPHMVDVNAYTYGSGFVVLLPCPKCRVKNVTVEKREEAVGVFSYRYVCKKCGHATKHFPMVIQAKINWNQNREQSKNKGKKK
jgi:Zn ribbon nucleic-acid-binding protein